MCSQHHLSYGRPVSAHVFGIMPPEHKQPEHPTEGLGCMQLAATLVIVEMM